MASNIKFRGGAVVLGSLALAASAFPLDFNLTFSGTNAQQEAAFTAAAQKWKNLFSDPIVVNLEVGMANLGGALGVAGSASSVKTYSTVRTALIGDASSADDALAIGTLQAGPNFQVYTNNFANNPNGANSMTGFTSTLTFMNVNTANQKALGIFTGNLADSDGSIFFNNTGFSYDYDPSNGITAGTFDFVAIAAHEIGHALGFTSGVDYVDSHNPNDNSTTFAWVETLDLFRYSSTSSGIGGGIPDLRAGTADKYLSLDKGLTGSAQKFSTGVVLGDGRQASHWKDDLGIGLMDPTIAPGELGVISAADIRALDVIGYSFAPVPEPATMAVLGLGAAALLRRRRKK